MNDEVKITIQSIGDESPSSTDEMGYLVILPDYHDVEGFVGHSKVYKIGSNHLARVLRIDRQHGYLDLKINKS